MSDMRVDQAMVIIVPTRRRVILPSTAGEAALVVALVIAPAVAPVLTMTPRLSNRKIPSRRMKKKRKRVMVSGEIRQYYGLKRKRNTSLLPARC